MSSFHGGGAVVALPIRFPSIRRTTSHLLLLSFVIALRASEAIADDAAGDCANHPASSGDDSCDDATPLDSAATGGGGGGGTARVSIPPLRVVTRGQLLTPYARTPVRFVGDWEDVLASPEVHVMGENDPSPGGLRSDGEKDLVKFEWTEGPLWLEDGDGDGGSFFCSDTIAGKIYRLTNSGAGGASPSSSASISGRWSVWASSSGGIDPEAVPSLAEPGSNGMAAAPTGCDDRRCRDPSSPSSSSSSSSDFVYICQHPTHRVVRCRLGQHAEGEPLVGGEEANCPDFEILCDSDVEGRKLNSPNDIAVNPSDGSVWFTDPIYGLLEKSRFSDEWLDNASYLDQKSAADRTGGIKGVYRIDAATPANGDDRGRRRPPPVLATPLHRRPNGIAFSPDGSILWISDSTIGSPSWTAYVVRPDNATHPLDPAAIAVLTPAVLGEALGTAAVGGDNDAPAPALLGHEGVADGFKVDEMGRLWASVPNGFAVIDPGLGGTSGIGGGIGGDEGAVDPHGNLFGTRRPPRVVCQIILGINTSNVAFGRGGEVWLTGLGGVWRIDRLLPQP